MRLSILLALLLTGSAAAQNAIIPGSLPYRPPVLETRWVDSVEWWDEAFDLATQETERAIQQQIEHGVCLYGDIQIVTENSWTMRIRRARLPAAVHYADSMSISFKCERSAWFLGMMHTHLNATDQLCEPSQQNFHGIMWDEQILVYYIFCANGRVYRQFKDGRHTNYLAWRGT